MKILPVEILNEPKLWENLGEILPILTNVQQYFTEILQIF